MASLNFQKEAVALTYAVLGVKLDAATYDSVGSSIEKNQLSAEDYVGALLKSPAGAEKYAGQSDLDILSSIYADTYGKPAPEGYLDDMLAQNGLEGAIASVITDLLNYDGVDADMLATQEHYDQQLDEILYPSYTVAGGADGVSDILALYYLVGIDPVMGTVNSLGSQINSGALTFEQAASKFINDRPALSSMANDAFVNTLFAEAYGREPTAAEFEQYTTYLNNGGDKGQVLVDMINDLRGTVSSDDAAAQQQFLNDTTPHAPGEIADLATLEIVASIFLAIPQRNVDAQGLDDWSSYLEREGNSMSSLTAKLITSAEFQKKGASLNGDEFIQHVYTAVHGVPANASQLQKYAQFGSDKTKITVSIINDLRNSTATDNATVSQQHAFEHDIGTSLAYKTSALLSASSTDGNATGTVNTGKGHVLSNAETAVLVNAVLDANADTTVNLKFADHLANLTINGGNATTVNLSDNGVNKGVDIIVNNGNVILNAGSGDDHVLVTSVANIAEGTGKFNLGAGNDVLKWAGNATNGVNVVSKDISANGGDGVDTISANFITKQLTTTSSSNWLGTSYKTTITTNAGQFSNFEKIDLGGYVGGTGATLNGGYVGVDTGHQFDFGVINGKATADEIKNVGKLTNVSASSSLGTQGFVLSSMADNVRVINIASTKGGNAAQLEVTGNATAASSLGFTFLENATSKFDINFTAKSDSDVNAGSISLNSSSSLLFGTALETVNINSSGTGDFSNILNLASSNQVKTVKISGDHYLDLHVSADNGSLRNIDASSNSAGVTITSEVAGTGQGFILDFLDLLPFSSLTKTIAAMFGLKRDDVHVTGSSQDDVISVMGNTNVTGGAGHDTFKLLSSTTEAAVTIKDFNMYEDTLVDTQSGMTMSGKGDINANNGTQVADYGSVSGAASWIAGILGGIITGAIVGVTNIINQILGLDKQPLSEVGIVSADGGSYVIVDKNGDGKLDKGDTFVFLDGVDHNEAMKLYYANDISLNGVASQSTEFA
ncbi:DUF4214 domain-containing protein [Serratia marcescens]|nr:DUF4214 domain-containing protein [Serratia marcescens]MBH2673762.1 DUF4214 domain-containing protein [Serratia marcescens]